MLPPSYFLDTVRRRGIHNALDAICSAKRVFVLMS